MMSIIGNAVINGSSARKPYVEYNGSKCKLVGFSSIHAECFAARGTNAAYITEFDFTQSSNCTKINDYAFYSQRQATIVNLPDTITSIGAYAFYACQSMALPALPSSLTSLGAYAFYNVGSGLSSITTLPDGVTNISTYCFYNPPMTTLDLNNVTTVQTRAFYALSSPLTTISSSKLTSIAAYAFAGNNRLTTIYLNKTTPPTLANVNAFNLCPLEHIYVPTSAVSTYQSATNWSNWASIISAIPT